jgi:hypothetical protein
MLAVVASLLLALLLLTAAGLKIAAGGHGREALATYGVHDETAQGVGWAGLIAVELALAAGVAIGSERAEWAAALLFCAFTAAQSVAIVRGRSGRPCACFGARGTVSRASAGRAALLAAAFAVLPLLPRRAPTTQEWLAVGLGAALLGVAALAVAVLALAREVGALRMEVSPRGALEIPSEGPEVGARTALAEAFGGSVREGMLGLAVFTSDGCRLCQTLAPAIDAFERDRRLAVRRFDEVEDADAWAVADVPGSPFAVALGDDGTVLAKGTFNTGGQLESVLAAAERRRGALRAG